jgi:tetratricopeptide (TPR) repeat protein
MGKVVMIQALTQGRLLTALRLAFYPAFEPAKERRFQALTRAAEDARGSGDLAKSEELYLTAIAETHASSDPAHSNQARYGLARVYQEQRRYREAESIFHGQLEEALNSPDLNTQVHGAHMCLARLYQDEGKSAEAEMHYKAAVGETEKPELWPDRGFYCSTALWLAKFYVDQHRYSEAEPVFQRVLKIYEEEPSLTSCLPHYLEEFARVYEAQGKHDAAEELYRRALQICEGEAPGGFMIARALDNLAAFCRARGRYAEAEEYCRRSLAIVTEEVRSEAARPTKSWLRWRDRKELEVRINRSQIPISASLDKLAEIYECQQKYAEAEPLRRGSLEINEQAWGEGYSWIWVDSLVAYANVLHKLDREYEATQIDKRVNAVRTKHPPGSIRTSLRFMSMPIKRSPRWRFATFVNTLLHPSVR